MSKRYDLVGIGHALVDVLAPVDEDFLVAQGLTRGTMHLIDEPRADQLYGLMTGPEKVSGGCAASTVVGAVACGASGAFMGTVGSDELGSAFSTALTAAGVDDKTQTCADVGTGRSLIFISRDGERTMNTFLGAAALVSPDVEDSDVIAGASIVFLEAYLFDSGYGPAQVKNLGNQVRANGGRLALSLSDPFCVDRHRADLLDALDDGVDICIGNEEEVKALFGTEDVHDGLDKLLDLCEIVSVTLGARGSVVASREERHQVPAESVEVVDLTGAGDVYASGFLYGVSQSWNLARCGRMGSVAAAAVISRVGARVDTKITESG